MFRSWPHPIHPNPHVRKLVGMAAVTLGLGVLGFLVFDWLTPAQHNPFKAVELSREIGFATGFKLDRLSQDPRACFATLDRAGIQYTRLDKAQLIKAKLDKDSSRPECKLDNALTLDRSLTPYSATLSMSCPLAATLYVWERHVVRPAAIKYFGQSVTRIETFGAYSCRRVNGEKTGKWSEHAHGNAVDISGFRLASGRVIMVEDDFGKNTREGRFLKEVRDKACGLFSTTLSPDYNKQHHNHLHFDMGVDTLCR
jgi:hypothetical protein